MVSIMRHPDDMKEKRKLNRNVICHDTASYESYGMSQSTSNESETRIAVLGMSQ
jgi:hypothetical protein